MTIRLLGDEDRRIVLLLLVFTLLLRLLTLMMIHTGVDERDYWFSARRLLLGLPYDDIQHRTIRFGVILPVLAAQALLGAHPNVYYVVPLLLSLAQVALVYRIALALGGRWAAILAALALAFFPYMIRGGSQVRPDITSLTYILASLAFFLRYIGEDAGKRRNLLLSSVLLFAAYQAKITNLYFVPGYLAAILLLRRSRRDAGLFCLPLAALYGVEHLVLYLLSGEPLGHLGIILHHHLASDYTEPTTFWGLFQRYSPAKLPWYWMAVMVLAVPAAVRLWKRDPRCAALALVASSFLLGITFAVARLRPVVPVEDFHHRYFLAVLGPLTLLDASLLADSLRRLPLPRPGPAQIGAALGAAAFALAVVFSAGVLPRRARLYFNNPLRPAEHPLALNGRYLRIVNDAYAAGTPILASDSNGGRNALATCTHYYLDSRYWPDGLLPQADRIQIDGRWYSVLQQRPWTPEAATAIVAARRNPFAVVPATVASAPEEVREGDSSSD